MKLLVTTPVSVIVEAENVRHVRAVDRTGAFGILPGHTNFITVLAVSVITWRDRKDREHHVAVRGGVLTVRDGDLVEVASREAVGEDTLRELGEAVLSRFRAEMQQEAASRVSATRLHLAAIRQLQRYLESGRQPFRRNPSPVPGISATELSPPGKGPGEGPGNGGVA